MMVASTIPFTREEGVAASGRFVGPVLLSGFRFLGRFLCGRKMDHVMFEIKKKKTGPMAISYPGTRPSSSRVKPT